MFPNAIKQFIDSKLIVYVYFTFFNINFQPSLQHQTRWALSENPRALLNPFAIKFNSLKTDLQISSI